MWNRHLFRCDLDAYYLKESLDSVVQMLARRTLNEEQDIANEADLQAPEMILVSVIDCNGTKQRELLRKALCVFCPTQYFPPYTEHLLSKQFREPSLYEEVRALPLSK